MSGKKSAYAVMAESKHPYSAYYQQLDAITKARYREKLAMLGPIILKTHTSQVKSKQQVYSGMTGQKFNILTYLTT